MEEELNEKPRNSHEKKSPRKLKKFLIVVLGVVILTVVAFMVWYNMSLSGTGTETDIVNIEIEMGSWTNKIAKTLKQNDLIKSELAFKIYAKLNGVNSFQAGKYKLNKGMSVSEIASALQTGKLYKNTDISITFVEGKSMTYIAKQIAKYTKNTEDDVFELLKDNEYIDSLINEYWFITDEIKNKDIYYPLEGYLSPNTYSFDENATVKDIFKTMLDQMGKVLEEYKDKFENSTNKNKYSIHQYLSIASIIENEGRSEEDRRTIASVIYNRLNKGMSLGCDATTYYAFKIELGSRDLYKSEINTYNPYNTRGPNMAGKIPVGPICMVSKTSIDATLNPDTSDYLYYVTDNKGKAYFRKTSAEHQAKISELKSIGAWAQF